MLMPSRPTSVSVDTADATPELAPAVGSVRPDGAFRTSDSLAIGLRDVARRDFELDIARDLSVVGFDDIDMARWRSHGLTRGRQPAGRMIDKTMPLIATLFGAARLKPPIARFPGEPVRAASSREVHYAE